MIPIRKAVIPVAGLGTRFLPMTKAQPKEMLPLVDKPVIQYVVEEASRSGISNMILITSEGKRSIENHFSRFYELEELLIKKNRTEDLNQLRWIQSLGEFTFVSQPEPLGLGHAVLCAEKAVGTEFFALLLGDDIFDPQEDALQALIKAHKASGKSVVGVQEVPQDHVERYGIVNNPDHEKNTYWSVHTIIEKPPASNTESRWAVVDRYILTPHIFKLLQDTRPGVGGEIQLTDALSQLANQGELIACPIPAKRFDTGNKIDYVKASITFALKHPEIGSDISEFLRDLKT
ncbi:MAG TPA: UTP--glucose-1-phosphate uridylyltransferase [Acidobacteria bacterium]|nr:UTP--glucose-1-phosphate uridylyltransferase [Acidobacteriota bacterium]